MTNFPEAQAPLILRYHRLMDAFAKSDDERDFYLDKIEGFIIFADLDKDREQLEVLELELSKNSSRYCLVPKMTFFEIKKFMEGFVQEKVYDIDTKEKLLDLIGAKEARENFLEFIYDNLTELEKWQLYYQERSRIRIIEWLRFNNIYFVFEEDLDIPRNVLEKVKRTLFDKKVSRDITTVRTTLFAKAKTYYSNEALNPRPKRGRPPKQVAKIAIEPQFTMDIYTTVTSAVRPFLYIPDITNAASVTFSAKFETEEHLLASLRGTSAIKVDERLEALSQRLESLQKLSQRLSSTGYLSEHEKRLSGYYKKPETKKMQEKKTISVSSEKDLKLGKAIEEVLPTTTRKKKKEEGESFTPQKRKRFSIKKVSQIKSKQKKKT